jgi:hypothetical protein
MAWDKRRRLSGSVQHPPSTSLHAARSCAAVHKDDPDNFFRRNNNVLPAG